MVPSTNITQPALAASMANNIAGSAVAPLNDVPDKIEVASYFNKTWQGAWKGRTRGMFTGILMGLISGIAVGALVLTPFLLAGAVTLSTLAATAALTGVFGLWQGMSIAADVGVTAGAVSAAFEEKDAREVARKIKLGILPKEAAKLQNRDGDPVYASSLSISSPEEVNLKSKNFNELVNWKVLVTAAIAGAALGLLIGIAIPTSIPIAAGLGGLVEAVGAPAAGALLLGAQGTIFGFNFPLIGNKVANFMGDWLSGNLFNGKQQAAPPTLELSQQIANAAELPSVPTKEKTAEPPDLPRPLAEDASLGKFTEKELGRRNQAPLMGISALASAPR